MPSKEERALALYDHSINKFHRANNPLLTPEKKHRKLESTIKTIDRAMKLSSNYPCILYVKAMVYEAVGEKAKAQEMVPMIEQMLVTNMDATEALATIRAAK